MAISIALGISPPLSPPVRIEPVDPIPGDPPVSNALERAKTLFYSQKAAGNSNAFNLILMAETALKNGNENAASEFARRALNIVEPAQDLPGKKEPEPLAPVNAEKKEAPEPVKTGKRAGVEPQHKTKSATHMYHDVSHDAGVSFTSPSSLSGPESFLAVPAHEGEHVQRRVGEATLKGERVLVVVSYDVRYDPSTGEPYMAGGTTRVIQLSEAYQPPPMKGQRVDVYA
jgi:hypothetical protein